MNDQEIDIILQVNIFLRKIDIFFKKSTIIQIKVKCFYKKVLIHGRYELK